MINKYLIILFLFSLNNSIFARELKEFDKFWSVLTKLESNNNEKSVGDGGKAIGIAQIHYVYWLDSGVKGKYTQCFDKNYSKKVVYSYLLKYSKTDDFEEWTRLHNSGPGWRSKKKLTDNYYKKFLALSK